MYKLVIPWGLIPPRLLLVSVLLSGAWGGHDGHYGYEFFHCRTNTDNTHWNGADNLGLGCHCQPETKIWDSSICRAAHQWNEKHSTIDAGYGGTKFGSSPCTNNYPNNMCFTQYSKTGSYWTNVRKSGWCYNTNGISSGDNSGDYRSRDLCATVTEMPASGSVYTVHHMIDAVAVSLGGTPEKFTFCEDPVHAISDTADCLLAGISLHGSVDTTTAGYETGVFDQDYASAPYGCNYKIVNGLVLMSFNVNEQMTYHPYTTDATYFTVCDRGPTDRPTNAPTDPTLPYYTLNVATEDLDCEEAIEDCPGECPATHEIAQADCLDAARVILNEPVMNRNGEMRDARTDPLFCSERENLNSDACSGTTCWQASWVSDSTTDGVVSGTWGSGSCQSNNYYAGQYGGIKGLYVQDMGANFPTGCFIQWYNNKGWLIKFNTDVDNKHNIGADYIPLCKVPPTPAPTIQDQWDYSNYDFFFCDNNVDDTSWNGVSNNGAGCHCQAGTKITDHDVCLAAHQALGGPSSVGGSTTVGYGSEPCALSAPNNVCFSLFESDVAGTTTYLNSETFMGWCYNSWGLGSGLNTATLAARDLCAIVSDMPFGLQESYYAVHHIVDTSASGCEADEHQIATATECAAAGNSLFGGLIDTTSVGYTTGVATVNDANVPYGCNYYLDPEFFTDVCDEESWPDVDTATFSTANGYYKAPGICGPCKVLVNNFDSTYSRSCNNYCNSIGRTVTGMWEEDYETCGV